MLIAYRPELENPPREGGFGIIMEGGMIQLTPGLNQGVPDGQWQKARENRMVKRLMSIGAIEEMKEQITVEKIPQDIETLTNIPLVEALRTIELIHHEDQLIDWKKVEGRVRVRNAINKRLDAIKREAA
jgi:hypothetical protein